MFIPAVSWNDSQGKIETVFNVIVPSAIYRVTPVMPSLRLFRFSRQCFDVTNNVVGPVPDAATLT